MDFFEKNELNKNQWHCEKCKTNWLSYVTYYDSCPFCGRQGGTVLVRLGKELQDAGIKDWWNLP